MNSLDTTGPYIWLRYATQYSKDGQTHTLEMSIPVPLGASPERREALIREAETAMHQLVSHVGQRVPQTASQRHHQDPQAGQRAVARSGPMQKSVPPQQLRNKPASVSTSLPVDGQGRDPVLARNEEALVPPTGPHSGASMPMTLGSTLESSGNLPLPEFIQYIHENLHLTPRQAMEMLKVKSLSTGVNLREALERLRYLVAPTNANAQFEDRVESEVKPEHAWASLSTSLTAQSQTQQFPHISHDETKGAEGHQLSEMPVSVSLRFDEEEDPQEEEEKQANISLFHDFASEHLEYAHNKIRKLREYQGTTLVSLERLQVLGNVIAEQISQEQLQELIFGIWEVSTLQNVKVEQIEALISWAKQDDFVDEVKAALAVLQEDRYARGNR